MKRTTQLSHWEDYWYRCATREHEVLTAQVFKLDAGAEHEIDIGKHGGRDSEDRLFFARYEASALGSQAIEPEHLLIGLIRDGGKNIVRILPSSGIAGLPQDEFSLTEIRGCRMPRALPREPTATRKLTSSGGL